MIKSTLTDLQSTRIATQFGLKNSLQDSKAINLKYLQNALQFSQFVATCGIKSKSNHTESSERHTRCPPSSADATGLESPCGDCISAAPCVCCCSGAGCTLLAGCGDIDSVPAVLSTCIQAGTLNTLASSLPLQSKCDVDHVGMVSDSPYCKNRAQCKFSSG